MPEHFCSRQRLYKLKGKMRKPLSVSDPLLMHTMILFQKGRFNNCKNLPVYILSPESKILVATCCQLFVVVVG
jgi:hypothetical protein